MTDDEIPADWMTKAAIEYVAARAKSLRALCRKYNKQNRSEDEIEVRCNGLILDFFNQLNSPFGPTEAHKLDTDAGEFILDETGQIKRSHHTPFETLEDLRKVIDRKHNDLAHDMLYAMSFREKDQLAWAADQLGMSDDWWTVFPKHTLDDLSKIVDFLIARGPTRPHQAEFDEVILDAWALIEWLTGKEYNWLSGSHYEGVSNEGHLVEFLGGLAEICGEKGKPFKKLVSQRRLIALQPERARRRLEEKAARATT